MTERNITCSQPRSPLSLSFGLSSIGGLRPGWVLITACGQALRDQPVVSPGKRDMSRSPCPFSLLEAIQLNDRVRHPGRLIVGALNQVPNQTELTLKYAAIGCGGKSKPILLGLADRRTDWTGLDGSSLQV